MLFECCSVKGGWVALVHKVYDAVQVALHSWEMDLLPNQNRLVSQMVFSCLTLVGKKLFSIGR